MNIKEIGNVFHCDCGFSWHRGKNGNHNCADGLREKVRQLAAENMALKNAITDHSHSVHFCEVCGKDDPCSTDDVCYALKDIPATDRIVAGIKADGVEEFAAYQRAITEEWACKEGHSSLLKVAERAELFAKQLREGADK
ncbi:TPA: hypothetical protein ACPUR8_005122 [Klebsiella pneumoniae]|nr:MULTISPECIES: hypothetical protein [Klebsiella]MDF9986342.1 hypothetical protein [Klebsiella pneumoniae]HBR1354633.1 hypothetical protein [Klebsiella quasipneumoniae subsp. quasipneumoniae]HDZ9648898.1 hypothetical protein [Klebsiella pneumoniae]